MSRAQMKAKGWLWPHVPGLKAPECQSSTSKGPMERGLSGPCLVGQFQTVTAFSLDPQDAEEGAGNRQLFL